MNTYKADLHIHTLLSPCGSLEMSPVNIVGAALAAGLDIIGIADHNSTKQAPLVKKIAAEKGLFVLCGAEVNTIEEVHCLTFFETAEQLTAFQVFLDTHLMKVQNKPELFGEQVVVDEDEMIIEEVEPLLINALDAGLSDIEREVRRLNGIVIPAHIDRLHNGLFGQLGIMPEGFHPDAFELSARAELSQWQTSKKLPAGVRFIRSSDAHHPEQIGAGYSVFEMQEPSFNEIKMALDGVDGRRVTVL
ncbi:MAG: PHP domain-containing protein [Prolixibacteraceae bacterium]|nr:PHP domain-containing protein [Prolixibacteraceae bacterium]